MPIRDRWLDFVFVIGLTIAAALFALTPLQNTVFRIPISIVFVFFVPGYAITGALFAASGLPFAERLAYSIAFSVVVLAVGGLLLHGLGLGFQAPAWILLLGTVTIVGVFISVVRWQLTGGKSKYRIPDLSLAELLLYACAGLLVMLTMIFALMGENINAAGGYTELWAQLDKNDSSLLSLGANNHERITMTYHIDVKINQNLVFQRDLNNLADNATWDATLRLPKPSAYGDMVQVLLYRDDDPATVYRYVFIRR